MSEQKHISKPEEVKKTNSGNALKEVSTSSQEATYGVAPGEMAFSSLQSTADRSSRSNGITQLQEKANQSKGIFQLQAKADSRSTRVTEPIQTKASDTPTTQLKGERTIQEDQGLEQEGSVMGTKTVQLANVESPPVVPNKPSSTADVAQLAEDKKNPLGGMLGSVKRFFGFKPPKSTGKKDEQAKEPEKKGDQIVASEKKDVQAAAPEKNQVKAVGTTLPPSSGEAEKRELALLQNEIKTIQEEISSFEPRLGEFNSKQQAFEELKEYADILKEFLNQKGKVDTLLEEISKEQEKVPLGRKKLFSGDKKIKELLSKDFSKLGSEEYKIIGNIQDITSEVSASLYWNHTSEFKYKINTYSDQKKQYDEIKISDNPDRELIENVKNSKKGFEILLENLKINKDEIQGFEEGIGASLSELDQKKSAFENYPSPRLIDDNTTPTSDLLLGVLNADLNKLKEFVIQDYEDWKKEKKEIDVLIAKKKKWFGYGLTNEEKIRVDQYLIDNSYLSAKPAQENRVALKDILKSLSEPTANSEILSTEPEEESEVSAKTNSIPKEKDENQSKPGVAESENLNAAEANKPANGKRSWKDFFSGKSKKEKAEKDEILNEKKLRFEYSRVGYEEKEDLKPGKRFIEKTPKILSTLKWDGLKDITQYNKLLGEDDKSTKDKLGSKIKDKQAQTKDATNIAINGSKIKSGLKGSKPEESQDQKSQSETSEMAQLGLAAMTGKNIDIKEVEAVIKDAQTVFSDALTGILTSVEGMIKLKDMVSGTAEVDGKNTAKVAGGIAKLAMAGLKITSTINDYSVTSTVMTAIPGLGAAIKAIKVAELYFSNSIAETSESTMEMYAEESQPPNFENEKVFERKEKNVLGSSKIINYVNPEFYKAVTEVLKEYTSRGDVSLSNRALSTINKKFNLEKPIGIGVKKGVLDLEGYISELETYSLMARLEEINFTKRIHSRFDFVKEGINLSGQIVVLIPGGQIAAGAMMVAGGVMGAGKSVGVIAKKYMTGDDNGMFGVGEYGKQKHEKYVMHAKKIIEMYSANAADLIIQQEDVEQAPVIDKKIERNLVVLEKVVIGAGAYPPDLYKSAEGDKKGYKTVGKLVKGMKQR